MHADRQALAASCTVQIAPGGVHKVRPLTVVFADISDSTALYEQLGDLAGHELIRGCLVLMREAVEAHGGTVVKTIGDELMCVFPDVVSATGAATAMQHEAQSMAAPGGRTMALRIGIHHGTGLEEGGDVFGEAVNVAARVVGLARAGQILLTQDCYTRLPELGRSRIREIDSFTVKGRTAEITIMEVLWRGSESNTTHVPCPAEPIRHDSMLAFTYADRVMSVPQAAERFVIGRDGGCQLVLSAGMASRQHATVEWRRGKYVLIDRSTNGTFVKPDGERQVKLKREEFVLHGHGVIGFGEAAGASAQGSARYRCE